MDTNILNEESNTLTANLIRIRDATDEIRTTLNMPDATIEELSEAVVVPPSGTINITTNGSIDVAEYESAIVDVIPVEKVAYFCDYDGTILYSYGADEIAALEELRLIIKIKVWLIHMLRKELKWLKNV